MRRATMASILSASLILAALAAGCVHRYYDVRYEQVNASQGDTVRVHSPARAHLLDGSTVVYRNGVVVARDSLLGPGMRFDLARRDSTPIARLALDSIVGVEAYRTELEVGQTVLVSLGLTVLGTAATIVGLKAVFGSCPTFYVTDSSGTTLEAEGFSYSILPLFEARDVDRLSLRSNDGAIQIELRNEALETHFINHVELLEVKHPNGVFVAPDERGRPLAMSRLIQAASARTRDGDDIAAALSRVDRDVFSTSSTRLQAAALPDLDDAIELAFPRPAEAESVAVVLRVRNSLLNTVLLYDEMLRVPGARAIDWLNQDLSSIGTAVEFGRWYRARMGMRIAVWDRGEWREVRRVGDAGPLAWKDVSVLIPNIGDDSLRVRLSFIVDQWRIDRVALASEVYRPVVRAIPLTNVSDARSASRADVQAAMMAADDRYLETTAGQFATLHLNAGPAPLDADRTFLLATQGYYSEWLRQDWVRPTNAGAVFAPTDDALARVVARYRAKRAEFETAFYSTSIPVR
jgi:hypothetical protein